MDKFNVQHQSEYVQRKCKGFTLVSDPTEVHVGGLIRYFTRSTPPEFKMGGKVTKNAVLFYEYEYRKQIYTISANKYIILYKAPKVRRSQKYRLYSALLESLENKCV